MNQLATIVKRYSYVATAAVLSLGMLMPIILGNNAGAEQLTSRSVSISTAEPGATGVEYTVTFTVAETGTVEGIVLDFCSDSPIPGTTCTLPTTMGLGSATVSSVTVGGSANAGWTVANTLNGTALELNDASATSWTAAQQVVIVLAGLVNPTPATSNTNNTTYVRAFTYVDNATSTAYTSAAPGTYVDYGSMAFSIVPQVDVSAIVRETLTFCVGGGQTSTPTSSSIGDACTGNANGSGGGGISLPSITIGEVEGTLKVLSPSAVSTASIFYQLTTNAAAGAVVKIAGVSSDLTSGSNIIPGRTSKGAIVAGTAAFGMYVPVPGTADSGANLTVDSVFGTTASDYIMPAAVEAVYGSTFASAASATRNADGQITFGATASADTSAGIYNAKYSLIATPTY